jgi:hypothetical protein
MVIQPANQCIEMQFIEWRVIDEARLLDEKLEAPRVNGPDKHAAEIQLRKVCRRQKVETSGQFVRGFFCESERNNLRWGYAGREIGGD